MRLAALALAGAIGVTLAATSANAAPIVPNPASDQLSNIVQVAGGCGRWAHLNLWGRCVSNRYGSARPYYRGYAYRGYYWRSPTDRGANQLNAHELGRHYYGYRGY